MYHKNSEKGQALVLIALAAVGLFAFTALAIDGSRVFSDRRHAQNAADTAALAAALAKIRTPPYPPNTPEAPKLAAIAAGVDRAASNGYATDADSLVEVHFCDEVGLMPPCEGLPATADTPEEKAEYIQVKIVSTIQTTFARIIGWRTVTSTLTAIARVKPGGDSPLFPGAALVALQRTGTAISGQGNVNLEVNDGGVFDNSGSPCAMEFGGNGTFVLEPSYYYTIASPGTYCENGNINLDQSYIQSGPQISPAYSIPPPSINCPTPGSYVQSGTSIVFTQGYFGAIPPITWSGEVLFPNGDYCFNAGLSINGSAEVKAPDGANFLIAGGDFQINGNSTLTCDSVMFHINGGTGIRFNGNASNTCTNVTFYASTGDVTWNGTVANTFTAPGNGTYQGLLIYLPSGNSSPLTINGNTGNSLTGSIIAPSSNVTIEGNSGTTGLRSSITGLTITLAGNSDTTINYNPDDQYSPADPTVIQLTK